MYPTILNYNFGHKSCSIGQEKAIDLFFVNLAKEVVNKKRFLLKTSIDLDKLEDLYIYLDLYKRKLECDECLAGYDIEFLKKKINKLINQKYCN